MAFNFFFFLKNRFFEGCLMAFSVFLLFLGVVWWSLLASTSFFVVSNQADAFSR